MDMDTLKCTKCGADNSREAKFCMECGAKITVISKEKNKYDEALNKAEQLYSSGFYDETVNALRKGCEAICEELIIKNAITVETDGRAALFDMIEALRVSGRFAPDFISHMHTIRMTGNSGSHELNKVSQEEAYMAITLMKIVCSDFERLYRGSGLVMTDFDIEPKTPAVHRYDPSPADTAANNEAGPKGVKKFLFGLILVICVLCLLVSISLTVGFLIVGKLIPVLILLAIDALFIYAIKVCYNALNKGRPAKKSYFANMDTTEKYIVYSLFYHMGILLVFPLWVAAFRLSLFMIESSFSFVPLSLLCIAAAVVMTLKLVKKWVIFRVKNRKLDQRNGGISLTDLLKLK